MKTKEQNISITINQEGYFISFAKDLTSLGSLGFLFWFNHNFIGGSYLVNFLILCMIFLYICKIHKSGFKDADWYFNVSKKKLIKIKRILESE